MSLQILSGQLLVGLINGSFYALLSLGFAVIFGLLGIINVAQGTFYMLGAFGSWMLLNYAGIGYWPALILSPVIAGAVGMALEKTSLGRTLRAATENPQLTRAFGINVPALLTFGFGAGVALAGFAGVLAAPIYSVSPLMGGELVITVFAVVVVGGMGSILGAIVTGLGLGVIEGFTKVFYPPGANMVIFVIMFIVLLIKPAGLLGRER